MSIERRIWRSQPPPNTPMDRQHPIGRSIVFSTNAHYARYGNRLVSGSIIGAVRASPTGRFASVNAPVYVPEADSINAWSLFALSDGAALNAGAAAYSGIITVSAYVDSTNNFETGLLFWSDTSRIANNFRCDNSNFGVDGVLSLPNTPVTFYAQYNWNANSSFIEINGTSYLSTPRYGSTVTPRVTRRFYSSHCYTSFIFDRALTEPEKQLLRVNPWQVYEPLPRSRKWISIAAGGAALPTLSSPTGANIMSTSFQPRVTYAY